MNLLDASGRLARWRLRLFKFAFDVEHQAVAKYRGADALSGLIANNTDRILLKDDVPDMGSVIQTLKTAFIRKNIRRNSSTLMHVRILVDEDKPPTLEEFIDARNDNAFCQRDAK